MKSTLCRSCSEAERQRLSEKNKEVPQGDIGGPEEMDIVPSETVPEDGENTYSAALKGPTGLELKAFKPFQALKTGPLDVLRFLLKKSLKVNYTFQTQGQCMGQRVEFPNPP